jgi:hypothetical protein
MAKWATIVGMDDDYRSYHQDCTLCRSCHHCRDISLPCSEVIDLLDTLESLLPPREAIAPRTPVTCVIGRWLREARKRGLFTERDQHACQGWLARTYL